jgi:DNA-binding NarL/FixJ family response regulator
MNEPHRVILVDDHPLFREALRSALERETWVSEVIEAGTVEAAMRAIGHHDVVVLDVFLPDGDGIDAAQEITQRWPTVNILILTGIEKDRVPLAIHNGVKGYVFKEAAPATIIQALRNVADGETFIDQTIRDHDFAPPASAQRELPKPFNTLTSRQRTILGLVRQGHKGEWIAQHLGLRHQTVKNQLSDIYKKLGVPGRLEAVNLMHALKIDKLD